MNTAIIVKTLTSRPARRVYRKIAIRTAKTAGAIAGEVVTYFAANKIIKGISKKTDFEPVEPVTVRLIKMSPAEAEV